MHSTAHLVRRCAPLLAGCRGGPVLCCRGAAIIASLAQSSSPRRFASTAAPSPPTMPSELETLEGVGDDYRHGRDTTTPSTNAGGGEDGDAARDDDDEFDELEAASQELHDLCYAMIAHLRCADPEANKALFERRVKRALREPKPEQYRRLLHGYGDRSLQRRNNYRTPKDLVDAHKLYLQWGEKLLLLLTQPVLDRLVESAGKGPRDLRADGIHQNRRHLERATWRTFPHRWFKHAPFEVQQLRADVPESAVLNTRFYRDNATLRYIFTLMEPQHPYRARLERRMAELTQSFDPVHAKIR
ncbi:hypothetical protein NESM_000718100 [Novymonas esmeraldas]|uniref:Uncharacterized protein n=1 Tax=Novymonas esmeraldas TaxID=1808958 RepID=A0AAW0EX02_9TRYP